VWRSQREIVLGAKKALLVFPAWALCFKCVGAPKLCYMISRRPAQSSTIQHNLNLDEGEGVMSPRGCWEDNPS
jgi:hypothetical protein